MDPGTPYYSSDGSVPGAGIPWPYSPQDYKLQIQVGQSNVGDIATSVYHAQCIPKNENVFVKITEIPDCSDEDILKLKKEMQMSKAHNHPNILSLLCAFIVDQKLYRIEPVHSLGSCQDVLIDFYPNGMDEDLICYILFFVLRGLVYLHETCNRAHRHIKAGHIFIDGNGFVRINDFSITTWLIETHKSFSYTSDPGLLWMSPDALLSQKNNHSPILNPINDIWALGITAIELATGHPPYSPKRSAQKHIITDIINKSPPIPTNKEFRQKYSKNFIHFLTLCLNKDSTNRPSARDLLSHDFFQNIQHQYNMILPLLEKLPSLVNRISKRKKVDEWNDQRMPEDDLHENAESNLLFYTEYDQGDKSPRDIDLIQFSNISPPVSTQTPYNSRATSPAPYRNHQQQSEDDHSSFKTDLIQFSTPADAPATDSPKSLHDSGNKNDNNYNNVDNNNNNNNNNNVNSNNNNKNNNCKSSGSGIMNGGMGNQTSSGKKYGGGDSSGKSGSGITTSPTRAGTPPVSPTIRTSSSQDSLVDSLSLSSNGSNPSSEYSSSLSNSGGSLPLRTPGGKKNLIDDIKDDHILFRKFSSGAVSIENATHHPVDDSITEGSILVSKYSLPPVEIQLGQTEMDFIVIIRTFAGTSLKFIFIGARELLVSGELPKLPSIPGLVLLSPKVKQSFHFTIEFPGDVDVKSLPAPERVDNTLVLKIKKFAMIDVGGMVV